jgi:RNA polymerase sigma-70 factor, ECF subfamily
MGAQLRPVPEPKGEGATMPAGAPSFEEFFHENHARLFASLCLVTGSRQEAEEIEQDAFMRVWERWDRVGGMEEPAGFLFRTAMNLFRRRYRRAKLAKRFALPVGEPDDAFATVDTRDQLVRALKELSPHQRAAVVLTSILGFSSEEAGGMLGIKDSTVRVLARNARGALQTKVADTT